MPIFSQQVEKHVLGGIFKNPEVLPELVTVLKEADFYGEVHATIYLMILSCFNKKERIDKVIVAQKIKDLGVAFKDDISIFEYIESISFSQITKEATIDAARELVKLRIRRELHEAGGKIQNSVKSCGDKRLEDIVADIDKIYADTSNIYELELKPVNVFDDLEHLINDRAKNPQTEFGLLTPFSEFNRMYGGLRAKNLYAIVSRPGEGKTTWISYLGRKVGEMNGCKVLALDTEMSTEENQFRIAASLSGVPLWYLETGNWAKNAEMASKVKAALKKAKGLNYHHIAVGNKNIDQVCSIARRWYYNEVGRGNKCVITYDYVKLTGEKVNQNWAEHQAIGEKIDKLKKLAEELDCPIFTAMQMNRSGNNFGKKSSDVTDDSTAIALSDRLQWFASFVGIFRRKTTDEIGRDGKQFGTHKLIPLKTRFQGKDAAGHHDLIKRKDEEGNEKFQSNYLNFEVNNFAIDEKGTLADIVEHENSQFELKDENKNDGDIL